MKFKVGDKVRYIVDIWDDVPGETTPKCGDTGVVTGHWDGTTMRHPTVKLDNPLRPTNDIGEDGWFMCHNWLECVDG